MSTEHIAGVGAGRTRTLPARAPDGFPFGFRRYRNYVVFAFTAFPMALSAVILLFGLAALGRGESAWQGYLASLSSAPAIVLSLVLLGFTLYFAIRWGWVGRKIAAGRVGPPGASGRYLRRRRRSSCWVSRRSPGTWLSGC